MMTIKVALFNTKTYDRNYFEKTNDPLLMQITFFTEALNEKTVFLAKGFDVVCCFVNDQLNKEVLSELKKLGIRLVAMRCAGYNNVDMEAAKERGLAVVRVPAYSPYAVAEHAVALILDLNRKLYRAYNRVREENFSLEGLMGFDLHNKTVGVIGTGKIGSVFAKIMSSGFACRVLAYDIVKNAACESMGVNYVELDELLEQSDIISLHCPLTPKTLHIINEDSIKKMKSGVMLINTGRGGLIDTKSVICALKMKKIGYLGLDVYEEEGPLFFQDLSEYILQDDVFARLLTFPNVVITGHQAFFTHEAMTNIVNVTLKNITQFFKL